MGETDGDVAPGESRPSEDRDVAGSQDTLQVPTQKKRKLKSPTPGSLRGRSATPVHGRSQTPFSLYLTRRSATPSTWRSITPFLNREEKEKTPFELGRDIKTQITCNKAVFDKALIMDISEPEEIQKPVRYITSDLSVIDRAAVMDVSNVEVIYVVEEYEEYEEEVEEIVEEVKPKKKGAKGGKKGSRTPRRSIDKEASPSGAGSETEDIGEFGDEREDSVDIEDSDEPAKKGKKKAAPKKKEKKEKSPSPKLTLKLEMGGGQKASKKMFEQQQQQAAAPKPPPKKSKLVLQMEEQARAAAKAAEEAAAKAKPKGETFEERQKRLKAEQEEQERLEAELRAQEEAEAEAEAAAEAAEYGEDGEYGDGEIPEDGEYGEGYDGDEGDDEDGEGGDGNEEGDEAGDLPEKRRGSDSSEDFTRPHPDDEERWKRIAEEEGEEFMLQMRKYSLLKRRTEKERDEEWQKRREQARNPRFVIYLSDRTGPVGKNVRLACAVDGPELSVKWFKDDKQLERDASHRIINNNNILALEIINPSSLDSGEYSCVIANMNDEVMSSCIVTIYEIFKDEPKPPSFRLVKEYYHLRDDELTIECHIHGVPRPRVSWWRGAFEVTPSYKFTLIEEAHGVYKLLIYKPSNRDAGLYTCKAINNCGEALISHSVEVGKNLHYHVPGIFHARDRMQQDKEKTARKAMEEALKSKAESDQRRAEAEEPKYKSIRASPEPMVSPKQKLKFATQLRDRMALEGSTVKFAATVIGPSSACRWMKDDKWITVGPTIRNLSEEGKGILEISKVTAESSGVYKCIAKNEFCEIETSCYFKVYSAQADGDEQEPMFALPLRDVYHSSQNDLIIDTKVRGNPRPVISWEKDKIPVVLDDRVVQIEHLDGLCELIINKPTQNDAGVYSCIAENKLGSQKTTHAVVVDIVQSSRRSSVLSSIMSDAEGKGRREAGDDEKRPPKPKKPDEEEAGGYERRSRMPDVSPKQQLYFIANLSNRYVAEGSRVKLQAVIGGPDPTMKWQKDDQNMTYGPKIRNQNRDSLAVLEFLNAQPEDSGRYSIIASNEFCKITTSAQLHVYQPKVNTDVGPVFIRALKDTYHLNTNELVLETGVRGQPNPEIQWYKDSIEIQNGGKYQMLEHQDGTLELFIDKPSNKDSGKYVIRAENRAGKMEISHYVLFEGKDSHIADNIHGVFHHDPALMRPKHEDEKPALAPARAPAQSADGSESEAESGGKRRSRKKKEDEEEGGSVSASATDYASDTGSIKRREKVIGIHFATMLRDRVIAEGSKVRISCFLEAKEPQVKWFKDGEQIQNTPKLRSRYSEGLCLLEMQSASLEDSGEYKCWGRDETGEASTICKVEVYADPGTGDVAPTFTRNIKDTYHGKINELQLDCHVRGLPTPEVTWVKDGVKVEPSDKYQQVDHDDGTCELFIADPVPMDSGKYVCQAENREGKSEIVHIVTVEPKRVRPPSPTRPPVKPAGEETEEEREEREKRRQKAKEDMEEASASRREAPPPPDLRKQLYFRNYLSNRTVKSGSNVKWMVNIDGPEPVARWYHGDQAIAFGPKSKMSCQDGIAWLNLVGVTEEEAGEYTLKVRGPENEIVSTCTLFVYSTGKEQTIPPTFTVGIKDTYHSQNNQITLECKISGNPKPSIYWQKDNTLLAIESDKYRSTNTEDGGIQLCIENPLKEDTGLYTCYAESESGQTKISKFLDVTDYVQRLTEKHIVKQIVDQDVTDTIEHTLSNEDLSSRRAAAKDNRLKLTVVTAMKPMNLRAGSKAQLICQVSGFIEEVYWLRDTERVTKDMRHKIYNINGAISLEIYDCRPDDSGVYKCVVRNSKNIVDSKCDLAIYDVDSDIRKLPTSFSSPISETYDSRRNAIVLSCQVHGRPQVTWLRDDHSISNNRYQVVEEAQGVRKLIIRNPIPTDCGTFSCFAETEDRIDAISKSIKTVDLRRLLAENVATSNGSDISLEGGRHSQSYRDSQTPYEERSIARDEQSFASAFKSRKSPLDSLSHTRPLFSSLLHDRTVTEGSSVCLNCSVTYDGSTTIEWLRNHRLLPKNNRYNAFYQDGVATLEIAAATVDDSGNYTCRAINDYGESITHAQLRVYKHYEDAPQPSIFSQSIRDNYSLNENELVLDCRVRGKPRPEIQWMKGNEIIEKSAKYQQIDQEDGYSKLVISNPTEKDSGLYSCVARNEAAENKITHQVDFMGRERFTLEKTHGFYHRDPNKPHFLTPLGNQTVCPGGTICISAEFMQTNTPIEVHWYRDRLALSGQPNVKTFLDKGVYTLAIMNATPDLEGTYTCRASNAFGRIETTATVDVAAGVEKEERPPLFLSRPENEMKIAVGDPFSISFRIAGDPKPKLTFLKGTRDITKSERISKEVSDDYTRFTVQKSQISDSGTYFVVARNNFGTDRIFVTVTVMPRARSETPTTPLWGLPLESYSDTSYFRDPPGPISTEPLIVDSGKTHISLSWGKPISNNSAPVIAYKVDAWIKGHEGGAMWKELGFTPINSFDAFNLKPNVEYHFRVTPKNRYGWGPSVQTTTPVQVGGAECLPEFVKILPGQLKALLDSELLLECAVRGAPRPHVAWYKDGIHLSTTAERIKIRQQGTTCSLLITKVSEIDAGRYTCEATNSKGRVSTFARIQVVADSKVYAADTKLKEIIHNQSAAKSGDTLPIFTMRLRDRRVQFTYPVRLTCQVIGYPTPQVAWFRNGQLVEPNRRCMVSEDGQFHTLELTNTNLDDAGLYTCTAKNELGSVSCNCTLVVDKGIRAYIMPEFYMPLDPLYIFEEGKEIRLTAKVEAYPSVGVSWHRNGIKLRPSRRIAVSLDCNGFVELTIAEANKLDAGIYMCVASNAVGRVESSCRVAIEETEESVKKPLSVPLIKTTDMPYSKEPMFVVKPRSSEAYEGDTVIIFCEVVGDPKPEVIWLRDFLNPEYYKDAPHFRRIGDGPEYRLEIPSAKLDFTGTYSVIANNCHGEVKAVISLQIFAKDILGKSSMEKGSIRQGNVETLPRFLRHLRDLRCCDGDAITLECHVEALPEPIIIWEKDGHVIHGNKDLTMSYDGIKATLSISRVYPEDEGEYTCVAKNNIGRTLSSACIIVDVPEENENMLSRQLSRPAALLSASSTPRSTPRSTPNRSFSPMPLSYRNSSIDLDGAGSLRRTSVTGRQAIAAPKFLAIPHNRVVEEGDSVRFQCAIAGHPMPWATWDKEGIIITPTTRIVVKEVNDLRFLEINEVTFDDAGLYRITLENDYGRIEATARLDVIGSSRYSKSPSARSLRASSAKRNAHLHRRIMGYSTAIGGRMALAAGYRGSSVPSCKFYKNGDELYEDARIQICVSAQEVKLLIDNVTAQDEGIYTCILQHPNDEPQITTTVVKFNKNKNCLTMNEDDSEKPQIIKALPKTIETREMETIDLQFKVKCAEPYTLTWKRNGEIIDDCEDFSYIDHGNGEICLRISDAFDIDSGLYTCEVHTISGLACSTSSHLSIITAENDEAMNAEEKLFVLKSPLPVITTKNDCSEILFCSRVFPFDAEVSWIICGHEITTGTPACTLESCETDGMRVLRISNVEEIGHIINDKSTYCGEYIGGFGGEVQLIISHPGKNAPTLRAFTSLIFWPQSMTTTNAQKITTKMPTDETVQHIAENYHKTTISPPRIKESPSDCITALIGDSVNLSVTFEVDETAHVTWYKGSRTVSEGGSIRITNSSTGSSLSFSEISADDSGKYTVEVMNNSGVDTAVVSVSVEGPPDPPSGKPSISQGPDRISIAWCGSPYDGGCIVNGFIIEMQQIFNEDFENEDTWQEIARVVDSLAYTVKDLTPEAVYRFRVRAENVHGSSMPSLPSDTVRISQTIAKRNSNNGFSNSISIKAGGDFRARFKIIEELGKGRFGVVYKVEEIESPNQVLAAKVIKCIKAQDRKKVQEEISIMKCLQHPKLLQLAATFESPREIVMVMEYITGGELFERVVADDFTLTERDCILFLRQICEGVAYMHSQSIVHLDLKPENIMCHTRTSHQIKIIDFGLAQRLAGDSPVRVLFGTPEFIPPEIISYEPIGFKSDMWSIGVICYVLLSGLSPFMGDSDVETFTNITRADYDFDDDAFDCVSSEAKDFISHLLLHRKEERWTALECLESTWLTQVHDDVLSKNRICTDKLKKFIIRRKWQKTGNAIRALGRMATLSASRRNSAAGSISSSPRPSITGASILHPNVTLQMSSLHEEDDNFNEEASKLAPRRIHQRTLRMRDKSLCSERSDSGYSECSNCSGNLPCQCQHLERENERDTTDNVGGADESTAGPTFSISVPHEVLKSKLEKIATNEVETIPIKQFEELTISQVDPIVLDDNAVNPLKSYSPLRASSPSKPITEPIMRSDFTNTIKMRKKSLEKSVKVRENLKNNPQKIHIQSPGRVSRLRSKFDKTVCSTKAAHYAKMTDSVTELRQNCKNAPVKLAACNNKTTGATNKSSSHINNSQRNLSPARLSERVRLATERLSKQHTISSSIRCISPQTATSPNNSVQP